MSDKYINSSGLQTIKTWITNMLGDKVSKASSPTTGNFMSFDASGNASDSGKNASDFATKSEANTGKTWFGVCSTAAATQAKTVTIDGITSLSEGLFILVQFTNAQTYNGAPTLNVNSLGAKNIRRVTGTNAARYEWLAGEILPLVYNGTYWVILDGGFATTTYYGLVKLATSATSTSTALALTPASLNSLAQYMLSGEGVYSASATYAVGDRVRYGYYIYECITAITTAEAWTAAHWKALAPLQTQIDNKQNVLTFDSTPTNNSTNPVTSGGIYNALSGKQNILTFDNTPTANSDNPVKSSGIKSYIDTKAPFFTIELFGENNPTLQEILQRIDNGETPLLVTSDGDIILTNTTKVYSDPEEWLIGLTWVISTVLYGSYIMASVSLTNNTLTPEQTYDSSQDTWNTGEVLSGIVGSNELTTRLASYLPLSGGNMTGDLYLLGDPTSNLQATTKQYVDNGLATKQNSLTFDTTPTANSTSPVTSGGIYTALQNAGTKIYMSTTEPANWNAGDWWYEEVE